MPPQLAANWFGAAELAKATSACVVGNQLGMALGLMLPPLGVASNTTVEIGADLRTTHIVNAAICGAVFVFVLLCKFTTFLFQTYFENLPVARSHPPTPPSRAQQQAIASVAETTSSFDLRSIARQICRVLRMRSFLLLMGAYSLLVGLFFALSTLLNALLQKYYPVVK